MRIALKKFAIDLLTGAGATAVLVAMTFDVNTVDAKTLVFAVILGAINGVINAARRYLVATVVTP